jgi:hypothetical protein
MLANEAWECYKKILNDFNLWASECLKKAFTTAGKSRFKKELQIID